MNDEILFGICADVHGKENSWRLQKFVDEAKERNADFIIQLGDFALPNADGQVLLDVWNQFDGPRYHVLGNHDLEHYEGKQAIVDFLGMPNNYYSFDMGPYHFVVLDTNYCKEGGQYIDYNKNNCFSSCYISDEQLKWLAQDLDATDKRCFLFTHATISQGQWTIYNTHQFRDVVWYANEKAGFNKVTMCFSGHDHADEYLFKGGVHYVLINSISHRYIGPKYMTHSSNVEQLKQDYGELKCLIPYKDPLYAFVRLKKSGFVQIIGKQSEYVGNSPMELHWEHSSAPQITYRELWMNGIGEL